MKRRWQIRVHQSWSNDGKDSSASQYFNDAIRLQAAAAFEVKVVPATIMSSQEVMQDEDDESIHSSAAPTTPVRQRPISEQSSASKSHLTTSAAASLASASAIPPPLLSRSSIKSSATQGNDGKTIPSLHIHLSDSTHQIRLSPSLSRPRSVLSTATDEGLDASFILDRASKGEDDGSGARIRYPKRWLCSTNCIPCKEITKCYWR